jgi:predicted Zn-dependent protease
MQGLKSGEKSPETAELQSRIFKEMAIQGIPSLMKTGNLALTSRTLENYLTLYPEEGYFYSVLGYLYFKQNRMEAATELLRRSIRLSSWNPAVQKIALQFFLATKNYSDALLAVENLLRQEPGNRRNISLKQRLLASVNH